jgi:hypothetical protein
MATAITMAGITAGAIITDGDEATTGTDRQNRQQARWRSSNISN